MGLFQTLVRRSAYARRPLGGISARLTVSVPRPQSTSTSTNHDYPSETHTPAAVTRLVEDKRSGHGPDAPEALAKDKVYIAGWAGAIGGLMAHSLAAMTNRPPIVLLHHTPALYERWMDAGETLLLQKHGINDAQGGFESQMALRGIKPRDSKADPIYNLIVASKAMDAAFIMETVAARLRPESTVLFLQNGMGYLDKINETVLPDPETRPNYMLGIVAHGAQAIPKFVIKQTGFGSIALTVLPRQPEDPRDLYFPKPAERLPESARYLLRQLTGAPALCALGMSPADFLQRQLEKLAANAVINPLTAVLGCTNGELLQNANMVRLMRLLLAEISLVITSLPELEYLPKVRQRFSSRSLELYVINIAKQTSENRSSMLVDIDRGKSTEISFLNGYIIRRGEQLGIRCIVNYTVVQMLRAKQQVSTKALNSMLPLHDDEEGEETDSMGVAAEQPEDDEEAFTTGLQHSA